MVHFHAMLDCVTLLSEGAATISAGKLAQAAVHFKMVDEVAALAEKAIAAREEAPVVVDGTVFGRNMLDDRTEILLNVIIVELCPVHLLREGRRALIIIDLRSLVGSSKLCADGNV